MTPFELSVTMTLDGIFKQLIQLNTNLDRIATVLEETTKESDE